jgi:tRNA(adenine34) deaminase
MFTPEYFMRLALQQAHEAAARDEVPVGAIVVCQNQIIAKGHNLTECLNDVTAHAEMQAITAAATFLGGKYLKHCQMYVTLEPCTMCAGALYWSQLGELFIGASDPKRGYQAQGLKLHPKTVVQSGILADECQAVIQNFFKKKR